MAKVLTAEERLNGLGGTDVAALVGVSTFRSPIEVYREKRGEAAPQELTWRMRMGQLLEDAIADAYVEKTGRRLARMGVVFHPDYPFLYVHPDRRVIGEPGLVECKATEHRRDYDNGVPARVRVQANWQMALTGRLWVDVVVLGGTSDIDTIRVERDQELIDALVEAAVAFWKRIQDGTPPDIDGSEAYRRYLTERHPRDTGEELVATPEQQLLLDELRAATAGVKAADEHRSLLENRLREVMGDATRLLSPNAVVTWRSEAPRTPWKNVAEALCERAGLDIEEEAQRAKEGLEGPRVMRISWKGNEG